MNIIPGHSSEANASASMIMNVPKVRFGGTTFAALAVPNYRHYIAGQAISLIGTWMQMTAMSWLVLTLSHSSTALGIVIALQTLPVLFLSPYGGVVADRINKRKLMMILQTMMGLQALVLGILTLTGTETVWEIGFLALLLGLNSAFENPARQSFMLELVGPEHLRNAVSLNSVLVNLARAIGPAIGGILIATVGSSACFLLNSISFLAVIFSLYTLNDKALNPTAPLEKAKGQLLEGLKYIWSEPAELAIPLLMMAAVGCLAYEFQVTLPYLSQRILHSGASGFGFITASMGVGAVVGGLAVANRGRTGLQMMILAAVAFGVAMTLATFAPTLATELIAMAFVGAASIVFMTTGNSTLQLNADPQMRGRVMSLWFVAFQGSTPIGGPLVGLLMASMGARSGLGVGAITCFIAAAAGALALRSLKTKKSEFNCSGGDSVLNCEKIK